MIQTLFYFIITLLLLVFVHEAGHFLVARWCGVKVLRCSFGFGKILHTWRDRRGTEYVWSLFPIGGYVKFLDEEDGPVSVSERYCAFDYQPAWKRIAIIIAGPLFNFLFAFLVLWFVAVLGIKSFAPRIDHVEPGSVAAAAHIGSMQEIIAIDDKKINNWRDVHYSFMPWLGSTRTVSITLRSLRDNTIAVHDMSLAHWEFEAKHGDLLDSLGIIPLFPKLPVIIDGVHPQSAAQLAGLKPGDIVMKVDDHVVTDWRMLRTYVQHRPGVTVSVEVIRHEKPCVLQVHLQTNEKDHSGLLGVSSKPPEIPDDWLRMERSGPVEAIGQALGHTVNFTRMTFVFMWRTLVGRMQFEHLSGPVGIAKAAGESAQLGAVYYLFFIAMLSISIGALNLLPIPILDGGRLLYECIELILRRPLSNALKMQGIFLGMMLVLILTIVALYNDLM